MMFTIPGRPWRRFATGGGAVTTLAMCAASTHGGGGGSASGRYGRVPTQAGCTSTRVSTASNLGKRQGT